MAVSKRTRFEVLRRDNHTCRYCGQAAPDVKLTVDHVTPVALGGTDVPSNLVAACVDCNAGKSSIGPDEATVEQVDADAARWTRARAAALSAISIEREQFDKDCAAFLAVWTSWDSDRSALPADWRSSISGWLKSGLTVERIIEAHDIAMCSQASSRAVFRYMAGVIRNWIRDIDELTKSIYDQGA